MASVYYLGITDYIVIIAMLVCSTIIGYKFRLSSGHLTTKEYLMAGRNMPMLPVVMSITVTMISAISLIGTPSEVYRFGIQPVLMPLAMPIGMALASYILIPVYFQCGVSTAYEYLEIRFGKTTRYILSAFFMLQMILYMSSALYAPVLALNAITHVSVELSILGLGSICAIYCALGGLKGVLWTDVFQSALIFVTIIAVYTSGIIDVGGITEIYTRTNEGGRLNLFNFQLNFTERFTFWNTILHGIVFGFCCYGTSQVEVQRLLSLSDVQRAKRSLLISSIPVAGIYASCNLFGLLLYALYNSCDPVANQNESGVTKYDQLVPFYLVSKFHSIPGLTGLCVAGIFCGSLSTISSALNSMAAVTVMDFIQPLFSLKQLSETKSVLIAKVLSLFYGACYMAFAFALKNTTSLMQVGALLNSVVEAPSAAVFVVGVLSRRGSSKAILLGFFLGFVVTSWIAYGSIFGGYSQPPLPLSTDSCSEDLDFTRIPVSFTFPIQSNVQHTTFPTSTEKEVFILYKVAFLWMRPLGFLITLFFIFVAIFLTGWNEETLPSNSKCLSPVTRLWNKNSEKYDVQGSTKSSEIQLELNKNIILIGDEKTYI